MEYQDIIWLERKRFVARIGIPEVDRITEGDKFGRHEKKKYTRTAAPDQGDEEDRISQLPNDVLQYIISLLTMKKGAVTSILSRRWRKLWRTSFSCLHISEFSMINGRYPEDKPTRKTLRKKRNEFIYRVYRFLELHQAASKLDALWVSFALGKESASHIDRWLEFAATRGVTQLKLDLNPRYRDGGTKYKLPTHIFAQNPDSSLQYLSLKCCSFDFHNFSNFKSLISLALIKIELTECDVQNILSNCSSLEQFSLVECQFPDDSHVQFCGESLALKHISCRRCEGVGEFTVHDINLLSFELLLAWSGPPKLSIKNAPYLAKLVLDSYDPTIITCDVPRLEILHLSAGRKNIFHPKLCDLSNLKQLVVLAPMCSRINLLHMFYLLEATPLLQKLELDMSLSIRQEETLESIRTRPRATHNSLKEVELYGFEGRPMKIEFAKYLLKIAVVLEKMKISMQMKGYWGDGLWCLYERTYKQETISSEEVSQHHEQTHKQENISLEEVTGLLQREKNSSTELIIESNSM